MLQSQIPTKFPIPFANNAGGAFIRAIPTNSQIGIQNGAASLFDGFPPLTFTAIAGGGTPPFGQDFNGLLNQISAWSRWQAAGGSIVFDSAFSTAVGGYPRGALIQSATTAGVLWINTVDNNTNNPDTFGVGSGWIPVSSTNQGPAFGLSTIVTSATPLSVSTTACFYGFNRTGVSTAAMPVPTATFPFATEGQWWEFQDLAGNFAGNSLTITFPGGHTIAGGTQINMITNGAGVRVTWYGGTLWGKTP